jgi:murein DD-endopeptidase MepM/ murein hydrolase activator NlpD
MSTPRTPTAPTTYDHGWVWPVAELHLYPDNIFTPGHHAVDIEASEGQQVWSPQSGKVLFAGWDTTNANGGYGQYVEIQTVEGDKVFLGHLSRLDVNTGESVSAGEQVGLSGNTGNSSGPHLHFEIQTASGYGNWINPVTWFASLFNGKYSPPTGPASRPAHTPQPSTPAPGTDNTGTGSTPGTDNTGSGRTGTGTAPGTGDTGTVTDTGLTSGIASSTATGILNAIKNFLGISTQWLKPVNIIGIIAGAALVTIGVTGLVLGDTTKGVLKEVSQGIGEGIKAGMK